MRIARLLPFVALALLLVVVAAAEAQGPPAYGTPINLEQAKKAVAAAEAEAKKNNWPMVITILDTGGHIVLVHRMDNAQIGSIEIARQKAWSAVAFRRPTKVFEDALAGGGAGLRILRLEGAAPVNGGLPIMMDGKVVGAIGVSGATGEQDAQVGKAGADSLK